MEIFDSVNEIDKKKNAKQMFSNMKGKKEKKKPPSAKMSIGKNETT